MGGLVGEKWRKRRRRRALGEVFIARELYDNGLTTVRYLEDIFHS